MRTPILRALLNGSVQRWKPATLASTNLPEAHLEEALKHDMGILGLSRRGVRYSQIRTWTQLTIPTPDGRNIRPDIIGLTDSGHVVIVEVKRFGNPELTGRDVIAQIVDYAAALSTMSEDMLAARFGRTSPSIRFAEVVKSEFPSLPDPQGLTTEFLRRFSQGDLVLVIACDKVPEEIAVWIRAIGNQSALNFELRVVEVTPYVCDDAPGEVIYSAVPVVETVIIARTAITISNEIDGDRIVVNVGLDTAEDIQESIDETRGKNTSHYPDTLRTVETKLQLPAQSLLPELLASNQFALREDWSHVHAAIAWPHSKRTAHLRGSRPPGFLWGRCGLQLVQNWKPSLFVGVLVRGQDHKVEMSQPELGADFVVIISVDRKARKENINGDDFMATPEFTELRRRLGEDAGDWDFEDHLARTRVNRWHPIHLRRPLTLVFNGAESAHQRQEHWLIAARDGVDVILRGGELQRLRDRLVAESESAEPPSQ